MQIEWDDTEQTTLRFDIQGEWTWDAFYEARQEVYDLMNSSKHDKIYVIVNLVNGKVYIPSGAMSQIKTLISFSHPKAGLSVVVGANRFLKSLFGGYRRAAKLAGLTVDFNYTNTLEEAREMCRLEHIKNMKG